MTHGYLMPVLHAHLPYVRHPEHEFFLEENWLYEAVIDCYIPLVLMLRRLVDEDVDFGISISLSPTLLEMLADGMLKDRLRRHMQRLAGLAGAEEARTKGGHHLAPLASMYSVRYRDLLRAYDQELEGDLIGAFRKLGASGKVELFTTAATHAFLPNLMPVPEAVHAQIEGGIRTFEHHMGQRPRGLWLPECGYSPGLGRIARDCGTEFFFLETHGVLYARPRPVYGIYKPVACPSGVAAFGRDQFAAVRVWCAQSGYPADPLYRDFYRDIGFEPELEHVRNHLEAFLHQGESSFTGIKYHRITGREMEYKEHYHPGQAEERARHHAGDFIEALGAHVSPLFNEKGFVPLITAPYDAELFGHWWFEGVLWLEEVLRGASAATGSVVRTITPSAYLASMAESLQGVEPSMSSWGEGGYSTVWTRPDTACSLLMASQRMRRIVSYAGDTRSISPGLKRALDQAMRELMLAQASDWTFMLNKDAHTGYARGRLDRHLGVFGELASMIEERSIDMDRLEELEAYSPFMKHLGVELYGRSFE